MHEGLDQWWIQLAPTKAETTTAEQTPVNEGSEAWPYNGHLWKSKKF